MADQEVLDKERKRHRRVRWLAILCAAGMVAGLGREATALALGLFAHVGPDPSKAPPEVVEGLLTSVFAPRAPLVLRGHTGAIGRAAFSPDGSVAATAGADGAVWLWSVKGGKAIATLADVPSFAAVDG